MTKFQIKGCILKAGIFPEDIYQFSSEKYKQPNGVTYMPIIVSEGVRQNGIKDLINSIIVDTPTRENFFVVSKGGDDITECFSGKLVNINFKDTQKDKFDEKIKLIPPSYQTLDCDWNLLLEITDYKCIGGIEEAEIENQLDGYYNTKKESFNFDSFFSTGRGLQYLYEEKSAL